MGRSAFRFSSAPRGAPPLRSGVVAADAAVLRGMSLELAQAWRMTRAVLDDLHRIAGLPTPPQPPQEQLFPITADMAAPDLQAGFLAELRDQLDLLAPAVEMFGACPALTADDRHMALAMLEHAVAARARMLDEVARAGGA